MALQADINPKTEVDPKTDVDPQNPDPVPDPDAPKGNPEEAFQKARQNLVDAAAARKAAEKASFDATQEYVRYRTNKPNPARGVEGDPSKWDPVVDEALHDQMLRAQQASVEALHDLEAAQRAFRDADAARARAARGRGGST